MPVILNVNIVVMEISMKRMGKEKVILFVGKTLRI